MMIKLSLLAAAGIAAAAALTPVPALAQTAPVSGRELIIYGNDKCPRDQICITAPEGDRYRIPENMRKTESKPGDQTAADRMAVIADTGASGIGSCSASGPGGSTGCLKRDIQRNAAIRRQDSQAAPDLDAAGTVQ